MSLITNHACFPNATCISTYRHPTCIVSFWCDVMQMSVFQQALIVIRCLTVMTLVYGTECFSVMSCAIWYSSLPVCRPDVLMTESFSLCLRCVLINFHEQLSLTNDISLYYIGVHGIVRPGWLSHVYHMEVALVARATVTAQSAHGDLHFVPV